jgi:hypothetical protein
VLKTNGYSLSVAATLSRALVEIRREPPVVILLDRKVITRESIRRNHLPLTIPIIVFKLHMSLLPPRV